jgi:hypothetical protein
MSNLKSPARAVEIDEINILKDRITNKDYSMFRPGKVNGDIFYPPWFGGIWNTTSQLESVIAPLGVTAFGGDRAYNASLQDVGTELVYLSRFRTLQNGMATYLLLSLLFLLYGIHSNCSKHLILYYYYLSSYLYSCIFDAE